MYYKVVAYKDYRGNLSAYLNTLNLSTGQRPLKRLKNMSYSPIGRFANHSEGKLSWLTLKNNLKKLNYQ